MSEFVTKRLYVGGLGKDVSEQDILNRFKIFGQVENIHVARDSENNCRGFSHLTLTCSESGFIKCLNVYNKSKWKGHQMIIEESKKPDYMQILQKEWEDEKQSPGIEVKKPKKTVYLKKKTRCIHSKNMNLVKEGDELREGWKKGKYGRYVFPIRVFDRVLNKIRVVDPSQLQHCLKKFKVDQINESLPLRFFYEECDKVTPKYNESVFVSRPIVSFNTEDQVSQEMEPDFNTERQNSMAVLEKLLGPAETIKSMSVEAGDRMSVESEEAAEIEELKEATENENALFKVNTNLRKLVFDDEPKQNLFSFAGVDAEEKVQNHNEDAEMKDAEPVIEATASFVSLKFFFFHPNNDRTLYEPTFGFQRTASLEDIESEWNEWKPDLTNEYKRKHKSSAKRVQ